MINCHYHHLIPNAITEFCAKLRLALHSEAMDFVTVSSFSPVLTVTRKGPVFPISLKRSLLSLFTDPEAPQTAAFLSADEKVGPLLSLQSYKYEIVKYSVQ